MTLSRALEREWRQLRLLSRDSVRHLLDRVVFSRDADPVQFAIWCLALAATPPFLIAVRKIVDYPFLLRAPAHVVEQVALSDRLFFIIYGMLATTLLAALVWEALIPGRADQEVVGVLPVRPRTLAAARLKAAATVALLFAVAINGPSAVLYSAVSSVHPLIGAFPRVLAGHLAATMTACGFTFLMLMTLRSLVEICAGERIADRLAIILQLVTIVMLVEVFLFLPSVLPALVGQIRQGADWHALLPPIWFGALYSWIAEGDSRLASHAVLALTATATSVIVVVVVSLTPAAWIGRRALENKSRDRAATLTNIARRSASMFVRANVVRSIVVFSVASLARSRRHAFVLATYFGLAVATVILSLLTAGLQRGLGYDEPRPYFLALPLVFIFFAVFGLRAACAIPTDLDANWPFRLAQPSVRSAVSAARLVICGLGVLPIVVAWLTLTLTLWPAVTALRIAAFDLLAGVALTEAALSGWTRVPFAAAHEPATATLKSRWPWFVVALNVFGFRLADVQLASVDSLTATLLYLAAGLVVIALLRIWRARRSRQQMPTFDVAQSGLQTLNLSEAVN